MKMIIALSLALIFVSVTLLMNIARLNVEQEDAIDSVVIYRQEVAELNVELTKALNLQQCYHEELIRVVFECPEIICEKVITAKGLYFRASKMCTTSGGWVWKDTAWRMDTTRIDTEYTYTIPCNGRKVVVR